MPLPRGYIHVLNHEKKIYIKSDFEVSFYIKEDHMLDTYMYVPNTLFSKNKGIRQ